MPIAELRRAYYRCLRALPRGADADPGVALLLHQHVPSTELLTEAWLVAGLWDRGQLRKSYAVSLLQQWALRLLEVGV